MVPSQCPWPFEDLKFAWKTLSSENLSSYFVCWPVLTEACLEFKIGFNKTPVWPGTKPAVMTHLRIPCRVDKPHGKTVVLDWLACCGEAPSLPVVRPAHSAQCALLKN